MEESGTYTQGTLETSLCCNLRIGTRSLLQADCHIASKARAYKTTVFLALFASKARSYNDPEVALGFGGGYVCAF